MPVPNSVMTEIVTTTLRNRSKKLKDNVTKNNALLSRMSKKGKLQTVSGGRTIVQELEYAENTTYRRYSGYEVINVQPSDVFTAAEFNYAQSAVTITMSGLEGIQNSGDNAIIDLMKNRVANAERTMTNNVALDCYSDGTADGGRQIGGLQLLISATPSTGTVGSIDASTTSGSFWRNIVFSSATDGGTAATSANIQSYMNRVYVQLVRGADGTDLIVADNNYWRLYLESLQAIQRITSNMDGQAGFQSLKYMGADVILDGGYGGGAPTNTMYFLNTDYIYFRPHGDRFFEPLGDEHSPVNQDAMVKVLAFAGNMTVSNRRLQGLLKA